jgi:hypothetical protein
MVFSFAAFPMSVTKTGKTGARRMYPDLESYLLHAVTAGSDAMSKSIAKA